MRYSAKRPSVPYNQALFDRFRPSTWLCLARVKSCRISGSEVMMSNELLGAKPKNNQLENASNGSGNEWTGAQPLQRHALAILSR